MSYAPRDAMDDAHLQNINPKFPKAAAGFVLLAGALGILTALQTFLSVVIFSRFWALAPYVLLALGVALVVIARSVFLARPWAAFSAIGVGAGLAAASGAWLVFAVTNGFFALYALWTPGAALLCVAFSIAALAPCRRAEDARASLRAEGLSIGL